MKMSEKELTIILEKHQKYLNQEEGGECADLRGVHLKEEDVDLSDALLMDVDLKDVDLKDVDLKDVDLKSAVLIGTKSSYAKGE